MLETNKASVSYLKCMPGKPCSKSSMPGDVANEIIRNAADAKTCEPLQGFDLSVSDGFYRFKVSDFDTDVENAVETPSVASESIEEVTEEPEDAPEETEEEPEEIEEA